LLDILDVCSLLVLAAAVHPRFKQLQFLKSGQSATVKAELETKMLLSDGQDGREKPPDATKKHKSDQSTAFDLLLGPDDDSDQTSYCWRRTSTEFY